jgi:single-strand DNA-binding protein
MSSFTINRVVLVGRLTRDPELRPLPSGTNVCKFRLACDSVGRDAQGEPREQANFFNVDVFGTFAESVSRYTRKGSRVAIDGRLNWSEWETIDQQKREAVNIVANTVIFLEQSGEHWEIDDDQPQDGEWRDDLDAVDDSELVGVGANAGEDDLLF